MTTVVPATIDGATVEEMWQVGLGWKWDLFANFLPATTLMIIAAHSLVENHEAGDLLYWKGATKGGFSMKYALQIMREDEHIPVNPKWDLVWKMAIQQRVKTFVWLILHDRLLCNSNRLKRNLTDDPGCPRCSLNADETLLHMLRDCPAARAIWNSVGSTAGAPGFYMGNLENWIICNIKAEGLGFSDKWPTCFALSLWWNWRWRNCLVFGRQQDIPIDTGTFIRSRVEETWRATSDNSTGPSNLQHGTLRRQEVLVYWISPPVEWFTLNTDRAAKGTPGHAGGGGILRDCSGMSIKCFAANFGVCYAYKA